MSIQKKHNRHYSFHHQQQFALPVLADHHSFRFFSHLSLSLKVDKKKRRNKAKMNGAVSEVIVIKDDDEDGGIEAFEEEREKEIVFIDSDDDLWDWDSDEIMEDQEIGGGRVSDDMDTAMVERHDNREWGELAIDLLVQIFNRLPADEVMRSAALVCTSWTKAIFWKEYQCWTQINLKEWCRRVNCTDVIDLAIGRLLDLCTSFSLRSISAYRIGSHSFFQVASR